MRAASQIGAKCQTARTRTEHGFTVERQSLTGRAAVDGGLVFLFRPP